MGKYLENKSLFITSKLYPEKLIMNFYHFHDFSEKHNPVGIPRD